MMIDRSDCLVDSNITIYSLDPADKAHQRRAIDVIAHLVEERRGIISAHCLTETFNGVTRKIAVPFTRAEAVDHIEAMASVFRIVDLGPDIVLQGCRAAARYQMSIWDALHWSAAKAGGATIILTQDAQSRPVIEGIRYVNPFAPEFDITAL